MRIFLEISSFNSPTKSVKFYKMNLLPQYTMIYRWVRAGTAISVQFGKLVQQENDNVGQTKTAVTQSVLVTDPSGPLFQ